MGSMMLLAACSGKKQEDDSWYRPIDEFVTQHQQMMQSQPDSMILHVRNLKCGGKPELVEQWKRLIVAKCCYLKGADPECQSLIDSVNSYCRQNPGLETLSRYSRMQIIFKACCCRLWASVNPPALITSRLIMN